MNIQDLGVERIGIIVREGVAPWWIAVLKEQLPETWLLVPVIFDSAPTEATQNEPSVSWPMKYWRRLTNRAWQVMIAVETGIVAARHPTLARSFADVSFWASGAGEKTFRSINSRIRSGSPAQADQTISEVSDLKAIVDPWLLLEHEDVLRTDFPILSPRVQEQQSIIGMAEVLRQDDRTEFSIEILNLNGNDHTAVVTGSIGTQPYIALNSLQLGVSLAQGMARLLTATSLQRMGPFFEGGDSSSGKPESAHLHAGLLRLLRYAAVQVRRRVHGHFTSRWNAQHTWHVRVQSGDWTSITPESGHQVDPPGQRWLADPFLLTKGGNCYLLVEEFDEAIGRGRIAAYAPTHSGGERIGTALEEPFHLSFPFAFRYKSEWFMCPESHEAGEIRLYRCKGSIIEWELCEVLMSDVVAADTMLFPWGHEWLMVTNFDSTGLRDFSSGLWWFGAPTPLTRKWVPLTVNPMQSPNFANRNAGLIHDRGAVLRVGQKARFGSYGNSIQVSRLHPTIHGVPREEPLADYSPGPDGSARGLHHLSADGGWLSFDLYGPVAPPSGTKRILPYSKRKP